MRSRRQSHHDGGIGRLRCLGFMAVLPYRPERIRLAVFGFCLPTGHVYTSYHDIEPLPSLNTTGYFSTGLKLERLM